MLIFHARNKIDEVLRNRPHTRMTGLSFAGTTIVLAMAGPYGMDVQFRWEAAAILCHTQITIKVLPLCIDVSVSAKSIPTRYARAPDNPVCSGRQKRRVAWKNLSPPIVQSAAGWG